MKLASLAVARGERHLSLVREPARRSLREPTRGAPRERALDAPIVAALPAWRRVVGAAAVILSLGLLTVAAVTWSVLA